LGANPFRVMRALILIGTDLLLLFVVLPLVLFARLEIDRLRAELAAAERVPRAESREAAAPPPPSAPLPADRGRSILIPGVPASGPVLEPAVAAPAEDPFVAEARRRAQEDPEAAMLWVQSQAEGQQRLRAMLQVVAVWAAADSEDALLWLESNAQGLARMEALYSGMELWGKEDPISAAQWIEGMASDGSKETAVKALVTNWVRDYPEEAALWVAEMPDGPVRDEAASAMVRSWAEDDPVAASVWAIREAESTGNRQPLSAAVEQFAKLRPGEAERFVRELYSANSAREPVETFIRSLAEEDPLRAARWLGDLSADDPLAAPENARVLLKEWSRTDSVSASAWIAEKAPGPERDAAIVGFAESMTAYEPAAAAAWTNAISDPVLRVEKLGATVEAWAARTPDAALEWLGTAELEPALREHLADLIGAD